MVALQTCMKWKQKKPEIKTKKNYDNKKTKTKTTF